MQNPPTNPDRRPLASRRWPIMQRAAAALAARRITPNTISIAGMIAGILAGVALAATAQAPTSAFDWPTRLLFAAAAALIQFRLLCNLIDGLVAVEGNMRSPVGELYNEVPDRISDAATLIGAGYALHSSPALGYLAAIVALLVAYIRAVGKSTGQPSDFRGPMAKQQRMAALTIACVIATLLPSFRLELDNPTTLGPTNFTLGPIAWALLIIIPVGLLTFLRRLTTLATRLKAAA